MIESNSANTSDTLSKTSDGRLIRFPAEAVELSGILTLPLHPRGVVVLASGINHDLRPQIILHSQIFNDNGLATFQVDLFRSDEILLDEESGYFRDNVDIMHQRLIGTAEWLLQNEETQNLSIGYIGLGSRGTAALVAAANRPDVVMAVVAVEAAGMAEDDLRRVQAPTMLMVAEKDDATVQANRQALDWLGSAKQFEQIPGVSSLTENKDAVVEVAQRAMQWFKRWLEPIV